MSHIRRGTWLCVALVAVLAGPARAADPFITLDLIHPGRPTAAPAFTAATPSGGSLQLSDFHGGTVLLNFWATWCGPCKREMPSMERLHQRYKARRFSVLAISIDADGAKSVVPFVKELHLTFPIALDLKTEIANQYKVRALPSTFLINREGQTIAIALGPRDWDSAGARAVVEGMLK